MCAAVPSTRIPHVLAGGRECCLAVNVIAILQVGSRPSGYNTYPQSHSLEVAKPWLQPDYLPRDLCSASLGSPGDGHWPRRTRACFTGALTKAQEQNGTMGQGQTMRLRPRVLGWNFL